MIEYFVCSRKGLNRAKNMDRVSVENNIVSKELCGTTEDDTLFAVMCDGVGSMKDGDLAAEKVALSFAEIKGRDISPVTISRHLHKVNREIYMQQKSNTSLELATTVAGIAIINNMFLSFNLGDTRIYSFRKDKITRLSKDHVMNAVNDNEFSGPHSQNTHTITSYIGGSGNACFPSLRRGVIGDDEEIFLICTDGIHNHIDDSTLKKLVSANKDLEEKARAILKLSLQNGSKDDMSIVLIRRLKDVPAKAPCA